MDDELKISRQYRDLGAEEPPRALDEAILAAARREAGARPGALQARSNRQRWYAPLATAAVLVLAVAVTLNMQIERPGIESPVAQAPQTPPPPRADQPASQQELKLKADMQLASSAKKPDKEMSSARARDAGQAAPAAREPQPFAAEKSIGSAGAPARRADDSRDTASSVTGTLARQMEERTSRDAEAAALTPRLGPLQAQARRAENAEIGKSAVAAPQLQKQADTPEQELERIAQLRAQGRHDEADKAFAEFRKRHPDYRISEAMRERVERR